MAEVLFELRMQEGEEPVIILFFCCILRIGSEAILIFFDEIFLVHTILNGFGKVDHFWVDFKFLIVHKYFIFLDFNFFDVVVHSPAILDQLLGGETKYIDQVWPIKLIDENVALSLHYTVVVKVLNK